MNNEVYELFAKAIKVLDEEKTHIELMGTKLNVIGREECLREISEKRLALIKAYRILDELLKGE